MVSDHVTVTPDVAEQYPPPFYEPFTTLAWLAGITKRIRLGTTVLIMPYRHPLLTARMAANLHLLSGGRFVLGVGVGWARQEFEALGVPFNRRGAMTDDYLAAVRAHWNQDVAEHHGPFVDFTGVRTAPPAGRAADLDRWQQRRGHAPRDPVRRRLASHQLHHALVPGGAGPPAGRRAGPPSPRE